MSSGCLISSVLLKHTGVGRHMALTLGDLTTHFSDWLDACTNTEWKEPTWLNEVFPQVRLAHAQCSKSVCKPFLSLVERNHRHPDQHTVFTVNGSPSSEPHLMCLKALPQREAWVSGVLYSLALIILTLLAAWEGRQQFQDSGFGLPWRKESKFPSTKVKQGLPLLKECPSSTVLRVWFYTGGGGAGGGTTEKANDVKLEQTIPNRAEVIF